MNHYKLLFLQQIIKYIIYNADPWFSSLIPGSKQFYIKNFNPTNVQYVENVPVTEIVDKYMTYLQQDNLDYLSVVQDDPKFKYVEENTKHSIEAFKENSKTNKFILVTLGSLVADKLLCDPPTASHTVYVLAEYYVDNDIPYIGNMLVSYQHQSAMIEQNTRADFSFLFNNEQIPYDFITSYLESIIPSNKSLIEECGGWRLLRTKRDIEELDVYETVSSMFPNLDLQLGIKCYKTFHELYDNSEFYIILFFNIKNDPVLMISYDEYGFDASDEDAVLWVDDEDTVKEW